MTDQEIHLLRSKCRALEKETRQLEVAKSRLQNRLITVQQSLDSEQNISKNLTGKRANDLLNLQKHYIDKFETATKLVRIRLQWELSKALQRQKEQLKMNFRSDLFMLTNRNNQLTSMLNYTKQQLQQADIVADKRRIMGKQLNENADYKKRFESLHKEFERQTTQLLQELKDREKTIERLQTRISSSPKSTMICTSTTEFNEDDESLSNSENSQSTKSGGPVRNKKNQRGIRKRPYNNTCSHTKWLTQKYASENGKMKELAIAHSLLESQQPFYNLAQNSYHQYNYHHYPQQQYAQCGGSGLETLPEADSEEESLTTTNLKTTDGLFSTSNISTDCSSSQISPVDFSFQNPCKNEDDEKSIEDFTREECENETHKITLLESMIKQLQDELRECKDQNELLEFRLLEIEEVNSTERQYDIQGDDGVAKTETSSNVISCLPLPEVVSHRTEFDGSNGHSTVTESRSSCSSDCSESLSLQESGIFENQGSDDGLMGTGPRNNNNISKELACLTFQIEELLRRYNEGAEEQSKEPSPPPDAQFIAGSSRRKTSLDLASEFQFCRQRIQEFEKRLSQMNDINYLRGLEEKVNFLVMENKRVEEERAEIEEAENDNRHLCQRLEEKVVHLQKKKSSLQNRLAVEIKKIDELRQEILEMQLREEDLCSKITKMEGLLQNYEQRNFELEETCIEMKCSVQYVIHSMPIFSLCYFWYLLRSRSGSQPIKFFKYLMNPPTTNNNKNSYQVKALSWPSSLINNNNVSSCSMSRTVSVITSARKHKLMETPEVEPSLKKSKSLMEKMLFCDANRNSNNVNNKINKYIEAAEVERNIRMTTTTTTSTESQTSEEQWKMFIQEIFSRQRLEWERVEKFQRNKIEVLELDIDRMQDIFDQERTRLIEMYETKLGEKDTELKENQHCQNEKRDLQHKWNCLIQELEQFALYLGKNLNHKNEGVAELLDDGHQLSFSLEEKKMSIDAEMSDSCELSTPSSMIGDCRHITSNSLTLQNYASSSKERTIGNKENDDEEMIEKAELIALLQSSLKDHLSRFEKREQQLLGEIDRLLLEIHAKAEKNVETESNMISHLSEENQRLQALFKDYDKVWGDFKRLQDENEKLRSELSDMIASRKSLDRKRLDESQRAETELRERLEELERAESSLKNKLGQMERKEQKGLEKIQQLRDEIQFLRNKCCQLQDDIDMRVAREAKYKNEIQLLANKLRDSTLELEEKETQLESNENALQTQISKLKVQLQELNQTFTDSECLREELREEVSYLEKTVEEAVSKAVQSENAITSLSHELKQKDVLIEELQAQLRQLKMVDSVPLSPVTPHELSDFNTNDGGLHGVVRAVEEVVSFIQRCSQCESAGSKLIGIVDRLIPLIQILKSSHVTDFHFGTEPEVCMSRCESDEVLISPMVTMLENSQCATLATSSNPIKSQGQSLEEDEVLIGRLQATMSRLASQISDLEENLNIQQKEMKDSYMAEMGLWKYRCEEKNSLIQLLARRIAHLSVGDIEGHFLNGIINEVEKLKNDFRLLTSSQSTKRATKRKPPLPPKRFQDFSYDSLRSFLTSERRKIMELFESTSNETVGDGVGDNPSSGMEMEELDHRIDFRVLKKIGDDALLVSWTLPSSFLGLNGYEIAVNGCTYLKIPKPNRHKAVLFGLNLEQPLKLTFRCPGDPRLEESTITFIS